MSKILGTIAVVCLAAAAFIAWKNQKALVAEAGNQKATPPIQGFLQREEKRKADNEETLAEEQARLAEATRLRDEYIAKEKEEAAELAAKTEEFNGLKKQIADLEKEFNKNKVQIAAAEEVMKGLPDPEVLIPKIKRMNSDLQRANSSIKSEEAKLANLTQQKKDTQATIYDYTQKFSWVSKGISYPTLSTKISAVYRNWGFVVIGAGISSGVTSSSVLDVVRDGEVIAKLRVTAVEGGRSAADIIPDSMKEGTVLRIGDKVVAEKEEAPVAANVR